MKFREKKRKEFWLDDSMKEGEGIKISRANKIYPYLSVNK